MTPNEIKRQIAGRVLRAFVDNHFSSYKDFAETIGVRGPAVSNWMSGRTSVPTEIVKRMGEIFPDDIATFKKILPELF